MIQCEKCKAVFDLGMVKGAAGVNCQGRFIGKCPYCDFTHKVNDDMLPVKHSDTQLAITIGALLLSGDNFCQRIVDELYEKHGIFPTSFISFKL
jgi:isopentenyl phosphate kinase